MRTARRAARVRRNRRRPGAPGTERGIALVLVLWLTILLTVIASGFAFSMRGEAIAARNAISLAQARTAADGAVERTLYELSRPRVPDAWAADGARHAWTERDVQYLTTAVDESSRIDINYANELLLKGLLESVGGLDDQAAARVYDAILDWRDADDLRRPNGAEAADYRAANLSYGPANAPFETVGELARVLGVTADLYKRVAPNLTVYSRQPGINPMTASRETLLAIPGVTPEIADDYIERRRLALENKLLPPPLPQAQAFASGAVPVWRIHAEATLPDGVTFVREAVVRPMTDPRRSIVALAWTEGARLPVLASDGTAPLAAPAISKPETNVRRP